MAEVVPWVHTSCTTWLAVQDATSFQIFSEAILTHVAASHISIAIPHHVLSNIHNKHY